MTTPDTNPFKGKAWFAATVFLAVTLMLVVAAAMSMVTQLQAQIVHLQGKLADVPQVRYLAVLLDQQELPALLVTMDPKDQALQIQRLNEVKEGREDTMQLWALSGNGPPRSLGILASKFKTLRIDASEPSLANVTSLAISVESKGGVDEAQGPRLPYLFKGWLVQKAI